MASRYTPAERKAIADTMHEPAKIVAKRLGRTTGSVQRVRSRMGLRKSHPEGVREWWFQWLYGRGLTDQQIADDRGVSKSAVQRYRAARGLPANGWNDRSNGQRNETNAGRNRERVAARKEPVDRDGLRRVKQDLAKCRAMWREMENRPELPRTYTLGLG